MYLVLLRVGRAKTHTAIAEDLILPSAIIDMCGPVIHKEISLSEKNTRHGR